MKLLILLFFSSFVCTLAQSQSLAINNDGSTAHASSILDITSTSKGLLTPRMSKTQRNAIINPAIGLLIYQIAPDSTGFYFYNGTRWQWLEQAGRSWSLTGNAGTSPFTNLLGTTDPTDLAIGCNNIPRLFVTNEAEVGIGTSNPNYALDITPGTAAVNNCSFNGIRLNFPGAGQNGCNSGLLIGYPSSPFPPDDELVIRNYGFPATTSKTLTLGVGPFLNMVRLTSDGLAGIGSGSMLPRYSLDINNAIAAVSPCGRNGIRLNTMQMLGNPCDNGLFMGYNVTSNLNAVSYWNFSSANNTPNSYIRFGFGADFSETPIGESIRILPPGRGIGINQINPQAMVHITNYTAGGALPGVMVTSPTANPSGTSVNGFYTGLRFTIGPSSANDGYIWNFQNAPIITGTNDLERMRITEDGKVGIGTNNPLARLHVGDSSVLFTSSAASMAPGVNPPVQGTGLRVMWFPARAAFRTGRAFGTEWDRDSIGNYSFAAGYGAKAKGEGSAALGGSFATGDYSFATGSANVASGGSSASFGFTNIASEYASVAMGFQTKSEGFASTSTGSSTAATGPASFAAGAGTTAKASGSFVIGTANDITDNPDPNTENAVDRIFQIGNGASNLSIRRNAVTVLRNGNVGFGELTPQVPLHFESVLGNKISLWGNNLNNHYGFGIQGFLFQMYCGTNTDNIAFGYGSSTNFTELMRIQGTGNVGIGLTNPAHRLHVKGTASNIANFDGGNNMWVTLSENGVAKGYIGSFVSSVSVDDVELGTISGNTAGAVHLTTGNTARLTVLNGGNVGIGTTAPTQRLHVIGNILASGTITPSDIRYKTNIQQIASPLSKMLQLNGVTYFLKRNEFPEWNFDSTLQYGVIAQEVERLFPEMVTVINEKGYKGVNYVKLIPVMIEGFRELNHKIEETEKGNLELKQQMVQLIKRIEALEKNQPGKK